MLTFKPTRLIGAAALALTASLGGTGIALAPAAHADTVVPATGQPYKITLQMSECGVMYLGTTGTCIVSLQTWMNWAVGTDPRSTAFNTARPHSRLSSSFSWITKASNPISGFPRTAASKTNPGGR